MIDESALPYGYGNAALATERVTLHKLAVREIAHSGKPQELLDRYGISARWIVAAVKKTLAESL